MYSDGLIDPTLQTNTAWNVSRFGIGQTLFRFDDNVKAIPQLAESATPSDGNKTWTIKLKKGVKFSNGVEMNPLTGYVKKAPRVPPTPPSSWMRRLS